MGWEPIEDMTDQEVLDSLMQLAKLRGTIEYVESMLEAGADTRPLLFMERSMERTEMKYDHLR